MNSDDNNNSVVVEYSPKKGDFSDTTWPRGVDFTPYFKNRSKMKRVQDHKYSNGGGGDMSDLEQKVSRLEKDVSDIRVDVGIIKTQVLNLATKEELMVAKAALQKEISDLKIEVTNKIHDLDKRISRNSIYIGIGITVSTIILSSFMGYLVHLIEAIQLVK